MESKFKTIKIIHLALVAGITLAYIFIGNATEVDFFGLENLDTFEMAVLAAPIGVVVLGNQLYKSNLQQVDKNEPIETQIGVYQSACIIRWSLIEGGAFFILFVTPKLAFIGVLLIAYMAYLHPSEDRFKDDIQRF